jgi:hypothetical protein
MLNALKRFDQAIMVSTGSLVSFSIFVYMMEDNCRCEKRKIVECYENKNLNYEKEINNLKGIIYELEKNKNK